MAVNDIYVALKKLWVPDRLNYTNFANEWPHCHLHVIPRYATPREVEGIEEVEFTDENWGRNYSPYDKDFIIPDAAFNVIRQAIRDELGYEES